MSQHLLEELKAMRKISTYTTGPVKSKCDSLKMLMIKSDSNQIIFKDSLNMNILLGETFKSLEEKV